MTIKVRSAEQMSESNLLVKHYAGSLAYGTNLPTSDVDFRGIFCADPVNVRTPFFPIYEHEDTSEEDTKVYEVAKFLKLYTECNPNIVETLWVDDKDITFRTPAYDHLRKFRYALLSSKIAFTTSGYALAQLKRIKGHNKWIQNPQPKEPPRQIDFISLVQNFTEDKVFHIDMTTMRDDHRLVPYGRDIFGIIVAPGYQLYSNTFSLNTNYDNPGEFDADRRHPLYIVKFNKEEYNMAKDKHHQYWTWKENRNEKRSILEEQYGYDTKHAMHLVRLLRMGVESLRDGEVIVKRPDAEELLAIRSGSWSYEDVVKYAESMDKEVREVWYKKTSLPKVPDIKLAAQVLMEVQDMVWSN